MKKYIPSLTEGIKFVIALGIYSAIRPTISAALPSTVSKYLP